MSGAQRRLRFRLIRAGAIVALAAGITVATNVALLGYATSRNDPVGRLSTKAPATTTATGTTPSATQTGTAPTRTTTTAPSSPARTTTSSSGSTSSPTTTGGGSRDDHGGEKGRSGKSGGKSEDD